MNDAFPKVISAGTDALRDLFVTTAVRMGTAVQYVEKDFWVCWTLDALFHGLRKGAPRLLFKGGISLSKGFGLGLKLEPATAPVDMLILDHIEEPSPN